MKLYYVPGACSLADHIVLEWVGAPYEATRMSYKDIKSANYLAINPGGMVPLLEHGDLKLTENAAILGYLADLYPEAGLLGDGSPRARAEVSRWLAFLNSDVHYAFKPIFSPRRFIDDQSLADVVSDTARLHARKLFERLDARLEGRDWLTGARSVADPYLFVVLRWADAKQVDLQGMDNLARFKSRMDADEGVRKALQAEEGVPV
ncbi:glutathione S-transferase family protein [Rhodanobacter sp. Col0626]|uniref:glutathione S-transferase family protein n=1 Tax=Rhodanobacter sp. Col0626 TaxID=3415679 RepID=UPI003CEECB5A